MSRFWGTNSLEYGEIIYDANVIRIARSVNMGNRNSITEVVDNLIENGIVVLRDPNDFSMVRKERDNLKVEKNNLERERNE